MPFERPLASRLSAAAASVAPLFELESWLKLENEPGATRIGGCRVCACRTSGPLPLERLNSAEKVTLRETFLETFLRFLKNFLPLERLFNNFYCRN